MVMSCKTVIQHHSQDMDIDSIHQYCSDFPSFTHTHLCGVCMHACVYEWLYAVLTLPQSRHRTMALPQGFLMLAFYIHTSHHSPPHLPPIIPWTAKESNLHLYDFAFSRRLNKWNHTACNLLGLAFHIQHNLWKLIQVDAHINSMFIFNCWVVFHGMNIARLFNHLLTEGLLGWFLFLAIPNKTAMNIHIQAFCVNIDLPSGINTQGYNCWAVC